MLSRFFAGCLLAFNKLVIFPAFIEIMLLNGRAKYHTFVIGLQLIATAVLFLASKSEETPCALNDVLKASCEVLHKQDFTLLSYTLPIVSILVTSSVFPCQSSTYFRL